MPTTKPTPKTWRLSVELPLTLKPKLKALAKSKGRVAGREAAEILKSALSGQA